MFNKTEDKEHKEIFYDIKIAYPNSKIEIIFDYLISEEECEFNIKIDDNPINTASRKISRENLVTIELIKDACIKFGLQRIKEIKFTGLSSDDLSAIFSIYTKNEFVEYKISKKYRKSIFITKYFFHLKTLGPIVNYKNKESLDFLKKSIGNAFALKPPAVNLLTISYTVKKNHRSAISKPIVSASDVGGYSYSNTQFSEDYIEKSQKICHSIWQNLNKECHLDWCIAIGSIIFNYYKNIIEINIKYHKNIDDIYSSGIIEIKDFFMLIY